MSSISNHLKLSTGYQIGCCLHQGWRCGPILIANNAEENSLKMDLAGSLILEVGTCRTVAVMLNGPVGASETHGPAAGQFEVASEGTIRVAVHADYTTKSR